mmetsp:Transcript_48207/g.77777  ORF Transcript_48207/g.77777 Transcript_48207/m.77777 type:complete len:221 (+) Transcript_48207:894-1556(+)
MAPHKTLPQCPASTTQSSLPGQERTVSANKVCSRAAQISQSPWALPSRSRLCRTVPDTTNACRGTTTICRRTSLRGSSATSSPATSTRPAATSPQPPRTAARPWRDWAAPISHRTAPPPTHSSAPARRRARSGSVKPLHAVYPPSGPSVNRPSANCTPSNSTSCTASGRGVALLCPDGLVACDTPSPRAAAAGTNDELLMRCGWLLDAHTLRHVSVSPRF